MDNYGTRVAGGGLPVAIETPRDRLKLVHIAPSADFLSQLIAAHQHLPPQRERRRASLGVAVDAYANGTNIAVRRMPAGYRTTVIV